MATKNRTVLMADPSLAPRPRAVPADLPGISDSLRIADLPGMTVFPIVNVANQTTTFSLRRGDRTATIVLPVTFAPVEVVRELVRAVDALLQHGRRSESAGHSVRSMP